jgi:hypothetical protein
LLIFSSSAPAASVGLPVRLTQVLPGSELEVKPLVDRRTPVVLRIITTEPVGDGYRYDFEYYGLEPGSFDLRAYLQRKDRSSTAGLPPMRVTVESVLPPGKVKPNDLTLKGSPWLGGYRLLLIAGGVLWLLGLAAVLFVGRRRRKKEAAQAKPRTLADHLRPLVEGAVNGRLVHAQLAELERSLILYWTRKLHLAACKPAAALPLLRGHHDAGPLLHQLETWLHRPGSKAKMDVDALLAPYRALPPDALEESARAVATTPTTIHNPKSKIQNPV